MASTRCGTQLLPLEFNFNELKLHAVEIFLRTRKISNSLKLHISHFTR